MNDKPCVKCGEIVPKWQQTGTRAGGYCRVCRHLLRIGDNADKAEVSIADLTAVGAWPPYADRQKDEPIPYIVLPVEAWPELPDTWESLYWDNPKYAEYRK